jgi:hypothetical protein
MDDETPDIAPADPEVPDAPPPAGDGGPEVEDTPLGAPAGADADDDDAGLPGIPEREPPASE